MYLSRLLLNPRSRAVRPDLARLSNMHKTILRAFPDNLDRKAERVLFRLDQSRSGELQLLIQSQGAPDWSALAAGYLLDVPGNPATKEVNLRLDTGQMLAFRLRANPTKRLGKSAGKDKGKRVGLYKMEEQIEWIGRKADQHGFAIHSVLPTQQEWRDEGPRALKFLSVQFDGMLQVRDPALFNDAIHQGIGSGKAFGFGLLSVAPVQG